MVASLAIRAQPFGNFDTSDQEDGRKAHLSGRIPAPLGQVADEPLARRPTAARSTCWR